MHIQTIAATALGAVLLAGALVYAFQPPPEQNEVEPPQKQLIKVQPVSRTVAGRTIIFSATTKPKHHAVLSFTIPARMTTRPVEIGDRVHAGELLAALDVRQFDSAVTSAAAAVEEIKVRLAQAERDDRRYKDLEKKQAVSPSIVEQYGSALAQLKASLAGAEAQLAEARRLRDEAELRTPFAGIVNKVFIEPGEWAQSGQPVVEVVDSDETELEVEVPETIIGQLHKGQRVDIRLPFLDNLATHGTIDHLARATTSAGRLFPILISLDKNPQLIPGMTAELVITVEAKPALLVPVSAVINPGGSRPSLFVLEGDRVHEIPVTVEQFLGDKVMVSGNLPAGSMVVTSGQTNLMDGNQVEVGS